MTNWIWLLLFLFALCLLSSWMSTPPAGYVAPYLQDDQYPMGQYAQYGGAVYQSTWWNPFTWGTYSDPYGYGYGYPSYSTYGTGYYPLDLGTYPSYDSGYVDGNSRGYYNQGGWYGQASRGYGWGGRGNGWGGRGNGWGGRGNGWGGRGWRY